MQRTWSNGVDIAFDDVGRGEPAVVLVHPALSNRAHFAAMVQALAQRHRVITLDLRGHGDSGVPRDGFAIADFANDVIAVCREAGVQRAVLGGHSTGGAVALTVANRDPHLAAGVVLLDAAILLPDPIRADSLRSFVPALEGPGRLDALYAYFGQRMFGPYDPPEVQTRIRRELAASTPHVAAPLMRDLFSRDYADAVAGASCPLLYIHSMIPTELDRFQALRPDALVARVAASGHFLALVVPEQVTAMIERFIDVLPIAASAAPVNANT